jgi:tyrosyl-tRNA synthetase
MSAKPSGKSSSELLTRCVQEVVPKELAEGKLASGKPMRVYLGIDPTGSKLHLGHSVPLRKLKAFQNAGHDVIFLVGSFTAMIGDPTGQDKMRVPLTREQVEENFKDYKKQAGKILDFSKTEVRYNHEWLEKMDIMSVMKLAGNFTVQQILQRDMFKERMKHGEDINPNEFLYPLMQGYDSVMLDVDCEIGGNDQLFNMLCGRKLQKAYGKREKFVLTTKLIEGTDGRKMSKTYGNCIYLDDELNDMFGKVMTIKDDLMATYFECCTDVTMDEVKTILKGNPRDAKARLAAEIVTLYHGAAAAESAAKAFDAVFKDGGVPDDMTEASVKKGTLLVDVLVKEKLVTSKSEAKRVIEQGGVKMNDKTVPSIDAKAESGVLRVGKRKFLKINLA